MGILARLNSVGAKTTKMAMASIMNRSTTSRITADFKHLARTKGSSGVYKAHARKQNPLAAKPTDAHPEDRIKWWNIVPGDRVRIVRGPYKDSNRIVEVLSVNKYKNSVMFKDLSVRIQCYFSVNISVLINFITVSQEGS